MSENSKYNPQIHHRRSVRLKGYDYAQAGAYFITICTHERACLFGKITDGKMILNDAGKIANDEWLKTPELRKNVELDAFIVMPNHIHVIILINRRGVLNTPLNDPNSPNDPNSDLSNMPIADNDTGTGVLNTPNDLNTGVFNTGVYNTPLRSPSQTIGAIVRGYKSSVTKQINILRDCTECIVWQRNYHEHIIRNEQSYQNISNYIINNPSKWNDDKFYKT